MTDWVFHKIFLICLWSHAPAPGISRCRSQYVVSVESSSLFHHSIYLWFICFPWWSIDGLENLHADRTIVCFEPWQKPRARLGSRNYKRGLEGAAVGVLKSYMVKETGLPKGNHRPWTGWPLPCHMLKQEIKPRPQRWQARVLHLPHPGPLKIWLYMSHVTRKPVFGVFNQVRLKPACAATEAS